jgi:hypothetical protein
MKYEIQNILSSECYKFILPSVEGICYYTYLGKAPSLPVIILENTYLWRLFTNVFIFKIPYTFLKHKTLKLL